MVTCRHELYTQIPAISAGCHQRTANCHPRGRARGLPRRPFATRARGHFPGQTSTGSRG